jgi:hypothetical protein
MSDILGASQSFEVDFRFQLGGDVVLLTRSGYSSACYGMRRAVGDLRRGFGRLITPATQFLGASQ